MPPRLRVDLPDRRQLLFDTLVDMPGGGLFCRCGHPLDPGTEVIVDLRMPALPSGIRLAGRVRWRRPPSLPATPEWGLGVELAASEWRRRDFLYDLASGILARNRVASRRIPLRVPVRLEVEGQTLPQPAATRDVGRGGVFIGEIAGPVPVVGTPIAVALMLPDGVRTYRGLVAWRGTDADGEGIGVAFRFAEESERLELDGLVSQLEDRLAQA